MADPKLTIRRQVTTRRLQRDLQRLVERRDRARERLPPVEAPGPLAGRGAVTAAELANGATAGIASPLTEPDAAARLYHPEQTFTSSDGVFTLQIEPIKRLVLADATGAEVVVEYALPPAPPP